MQPRMDERVDPVSQVVYEEFTREVLQTGARGAHFDTFDVFEGRGVIVDANHADRLGDVSRTNMLCTLITGGPIAVVMQANDCLFIAVLHSHKVIGKQPALLT
jgi:hypothetical protein